MKKLEVLLVVIGLVIIFVAIDVACFNIFGTFGGLFTMGIEFITAGCLVNSYRTR